MQESNVQRLGSIASDNDIRSADRGVLGNIVIGITFYYLTSLIVMLGAMFAFDFVSPSPDRPPRPNDDLVARFANWDGGFYVEIATEGYSYSPDRLSSVAFFPAFPLLGGALAKATGIRAEWALLIVAHLSLCGAFAVMAMYVQRRSPAGPRELAEYALLAMGLFPTTFFMRMAYTESLLLFLVILAMYGMVQKWPDWRIALIIGLATATRSVGVTLLAPFVIHLWCEHRPLARLLPRTALLIPLACWGLLAFMAYQVWAFGDPLTFIKAHYAWHQRPIPPAAEQALALVTLEPIRAVYDSSCPCYWGRITPHEDFLFNLRFAEPIFFIFTVALVAVGARMKWLSRGEWVLATLLLLTPYVLQAYRMCMISQARCASVVFPIYIVVAELLVRIPGPIRAVILCISGFMLAAYAGLFIQRYLFW